MKKCLFGGALFAAGLGSGVASAQEFEFSYTLALTTVGDPVDMDPYVMDDFAGAGFFDISVSYADSSAAASASATQMKGTSILNDGPGLFAGSGSFFAYFTVTGDTTINASWDFTGDSLGPNVIPSTIFIHDLTNNVILLNETALSMTTGSVDIQLHAGTEYFAQALAVAGDLDVGTSLYSITIPAPASGGLLLLVGLGSARRRR
jgi:hypothetical protein